MTDRSEATDNTLQNNQGNVTPGTVTDGLESSADQPPAHTHAGNTGFSSGQISPQTHNPSNAGKSKDDAPTDEATGSGKATQK